MTVSVSSFSNYSTNTDNLGIFIFISICFHVPDDLVCKQLGKFCCLHNISLHIAQDIVTQCLHNLRNVKECHIYRMTFQGSHSILQDERMMPVRRKKVRDGTDRVHRGPIQQVLQQLVTWIG
jgi:hypothetical protein